MKKPIYNLGELIYIAGNDPNYRPNKIDTFTFLDHIAKLERQVKELREALRKVEFDYENAACFWCGGEYPNHYPNCERQAALEATKGVPMKYEDAMIEDDFVRIKHKIVGGRIYGKTVDGNDWKTLVVAAYHAGMFSEQEYYLNVRNQERRLLGG